MDTEETIKCFVEKWISKAGTEKASPKDLEDTEKQIGFTLPESYKFILLNYGVLYTPDLLDAIVDAELDMSELQNFSNPKEMLEQSQMYTSAGMPEGFLCFASDSMGNMFCFNIEECKNQSEPGVWFFDHDFCEIEKIFENINGWLLSYNQVSL
jgi:hypothetical protein